MKNQFIIIFLFFICFQSKAQFNFDKQVKNEIKYSEDIIDEVYGITIYEPLNLGLSPDSVRMENGYAVNNWKQKEMQVRSAYLCIDASINRRLSMY